MKRYILITSCALFAILSASAQNNDCNTVIAFDDASDNKIPTGTTTKKEIHISGVKRITTNSVKENTLLVANTTHIGNGFSARVEGNNSFAIHAVSNPCPANKKPGNKDNGQPGEAEVIISPNPNNGRFNVFINAEGNYQLSIANTLGQIVYSAEITGLINNTIQLAEALTDNTYVVTVSNKTIRYISKITTLK